METPSRAVLKTLMVTDLVASTQLVEKIGDQKATEVFTQVDRVARSLLREHDGREIDKTDGFLILFERPINAVSFALDFHHALEEVGKKLDVALCARVGIHLGEVILRENAPEDISLGAKPIEVEGLSKPFTARLMSVGLGRQTLMTRGAFDLARRAMVGATRTRRLRWLSHGRYVFHGVNDSVEVYEVGIADTSPLSPPPDTEKVRHVQDDDTITGWRPASGEDIPQRANWILDRKLGQGGFGEVWLATQIKTKDRRVYKFCYQADRLRSFKREVTLFRLLKESLGDREDIARLIDWNFDDPPYFIESEYTAGGDLIEWLGKNGGPEKVPRPLRLMIVAQVGEALAAAHSIGVLHKDVKPANILIHTTQDGWPQARLTDFGIGLITNEGQLEKVGITASGLTEMDDAPTQSTVGTRLYMAPELIEGKAASVEADIYALGVVLYQIVVGDFSKAMAEGWTRDIDDELLLEDIGAMVEGSPELRLGSGKEIAQRIRSLPERRKKIEEESEEKEREEEARRKEALNRRRSKITISATVLFATVMILGLVQRSILNRRAEANNRTAIDNEEMDAKEAFDAYLSREEELRRKVEEIDKNDPLEIREVERKRRDLLIELEDISSTYVTALTLPTTTEYRRNELIKMATEANFRLFLLADAMGETVLRKRAGKWATRCNERRGDERDPEIDRAVSGHGTLRVTSNAPGFKAYLFRYETSAHQEDPYYQRSVPIPVPFLDSKSPASQDRVLGVRVKRNRKNTNLGPLGIPTRDRLLSNRESGEVELNRPASDFPPERCRIGVLEKFHPIAMGSYLLIGTAPTMATTRLPFVVRRNGEVDLSVEMLAKEQVPEDYVFVHGGETQVFGGILFPYRRPERVTHVDSFLISKREVTEGQYTGFLNGLLADGESMRIVKFLRPTTKATRLRFDPEKNEFVTAMPDRPVVGITIRSAAAYTAWRTGIETPEKMLIRLPTELEWERAARGADGRTFPWGDLFSPDFCSMGRSVDTPVPGLCGLFLADISPFGVLDLAGNVSELCGPIEINGTQIENPDASLGNRNDFFARGGNFTSDVPDFCSTTIRLVRGAMAGSDQVGFRVVRSLTEVGED